MVTAHQFECPYCHTLAKLRYSVTTSIVGDVVSIDDDGFVATKDDNGPIRWRVQFECGHCEHAIGDDLAMRHVPRHRK